jgi:hypothetical protein
MAQPIADDKVVAVQAVLVVLYPMKVLFMVVAVVHQIAQAVAQVGQ